MARKLAAEEKRKAEEKAPTPSSARTPPSERRIEERAKASTPTSSRRRRRPRGHRRRSIRRDSKKWAVGLELKNACASLTSPSSSSRSTRPCSRAGTLPRSRFRGTKRQQRRRWPSSTTGRRGRIWGHHGGQPEGAGWSSIKHVTDDGFFGRGIYTTDRIETVAFAYAERCVCCVLGAAGASTRPRRSGMRMPKKAGYDSHLEFTGGQALGSCFLTQTRCCRAILWINRNHTRGPRRPGTGRESGG